MSRLDAVRAAAAHHALLLIGFPTSVVAVHNVTFFLGINSVRHMVFLNFPSFWSTRCLHAAYTLCAAGLDVALTPVIGRALRRSSRSSRCSFPFSFTLDQGAVSPLFTWVAIFQRRFACRSAEHLRAPVHTSYLPPPPSSSTATTRRQQSTDSTASLYPIEYKGNAVRLCACMIQLQPKDRPRRAHVNAHRNAPADPQRPHISPHESVRMSRRRPRVQTT